jgi:hypothetical protein
MIFNIALQRISIWRSRGLWSIHSPVVRLLVMSSLIKLLDKFYCVININISATG